MFGPPHFHEDRVYFWRKAGKALKKSRKTGKNTENVAGNRKTPMWSHGKLKKNLRKAGKSIFYLQKAGNKPPIPGPLSYFNFNYTCTTFKENCSI